MHKPVLLSEVVEALKIKPDGVFVDGTFGRGGHSLAILQGLSDKGRLFAMDLDPEVLQFGFADPRFVLEQKNSAEIRQWAHEKALKGKINGVLLDLGVSSPQLDEARRGFSFLREGPLDMRLNPQQGISAAQWLNKVSRQDLKRVLWTFGEERFAGRIATAIVKNRPVYTTTELAHWVASVVPNKERHKHPATRTFQAIRIFINKELQSLEKFLDGVVDVMAPGGRIAIISFHSLEDRIVKRFFRRLSKGDELPRKLPVPQVDISPRLKIVGKMQRPSAQEIAANPRARSALLRIAEKIA